MAQNVPEMCPSVPERDEGYPKEVDAGKGRRLSLFVYVPQDLNAL